MAEALQGKAIDVAELCSTQPAIAQFGFVVLEDDKKTQPAENIAPIVRDDYLAKVDKAAFQALLDGASAKLTTEALTEMGVEVAVDQKDVKDVASAFLKAQGLIKWPSSRSHTAPKPARSPGRASSCPTVGASMNRR